ncbi:Uncharacterised protein [Mycobacteroides abscessus subsp. abscessus]|nr:Uncharacterised protein [Mycobacteroides abscessus subsp. abscessus]
MGDDHRGASTCDGFARREDQRFGRLVEGRGRFVEKQEVGVDQFGPRERDELTLARRQSAAAFADLVAHPAVESGDDIGGADGECSGRDLCPVGVGSAVGDVLGDAPGEQVWFLGYEADPMSVVEQSEVADVGPIDADLAAGGVVEAGEQFDDRRFARPRASHERQR